MVDIILDTLLDGLKLIPFLLLAFFIIELFEHKYSKKSKKFISKSGKFGPFIGALVGAFPQCGFSVAATNLYVTRIISLGTLISVYLSTSDEMIPVLISEQAEASLIIKVVLIKVLLGMIYGFIIDLLLRKKQKNAQNYSLCEDDHCDCEHNLFLSALKHTFKTLSFIIAITFILNLLFAYLGEDTLSSMFIKNSIFAPFITSLVGLIPNCGASVMITELYIKGVLTIGSTIGGLLTGSGVALLVLFRQNKSIKENIMILFIVYLLGSLTGLIFNILGVIL